MVGATGEPHAGGVGAVCGHSNCVESSVECPTVDLPSGCVDVWSHKIGDSVCRSADGSSYHSGCNDD